MSCLTLTFRDRYPAPALRFSDGRCSFALGVATAATPIAVTELFRGPAGPQGPSGPVGGYTHLQSSASDAWTINHNLGVKPAVALYTVGGVEFEAQITHTSDNQCVASLVTSISGFARCN